MASDFFIAPEPSPTLKLINRPNQQRSEARVIATAKRAQAREKDSRVGGDRVKCERVQLRGVFSWGDHTKMTMSEKKLSDKIVKSCKHVLCETQVRTILKLTFYHIL